VIYNLISPLIRGISSR